MNARERLRKYMSGRGIDLSDDDLDGLIDLVLNIRTESLREVKK